jgi:hypothetical protein
VEEAPRAGKVEPTCLEGDEDIAASAVKIARRLASFQGACGKVKTDHVTN